MEKEISSTRSSKSIKFDGEPSQTYTVSPLRFHLSPFTLKHSTRLPLKCNNYSRLEHKWINTYSSCISVIVSPGYLQAISCNMPVKVNLWPLGSVNSWATNTNKARMEKTHASTEVAWIVWIYSATPQWQNRHIQSVTCPRQYKAICITLESHYDNLEEQFHLQNYILPVVIHEQLQYTD